MYNTHLHQLRLTCANISDMLISSIYSIIPFVKQNKNVVPKYLSNIINNNSNHWDTYKNTTKQDFRVL